MCWFFSSYQTGCNNIFWVIISPPLQFSLCCPFSCDHTNICISSLTFGLVELRYVSSLGTHRPCDLILDTYNRLFWVSMHTSLLKFLFDQKCPKFLVYHPPIDSLVQIFQYWPLPGFLPNFPPSSTHRSVL